MVTQTHWKVCLQLQIFFVSLKWNLVVLILSENFKGSVILRNRQELCSVLLAKDEERSSGVAVLLLKVLLKIWPKVWIWSSWRLGLDPFEIVVLLCSLKSFRFCDLLIYCHLTPHCFLFQPWSVWNYAWWAFKTSNWYQTVLAEEILVEPVKLPLNSADFQRRERHG